MGFDPKIYAKGERRPYAARKDGPQKFFYIRVGVIQDVDPDRYTMIVNWNHGGTRGRVPVSFSYAGPAGCQGMLPEKGALGIFGFYDTGSETKNPVLLGYLPAGLSAGLDQNVVKINPDFIADDDVNEVQFKHRKLGPGDMVMSSPNGSSVFLNNDVELSDEMHDKILIREGDQSIILTSINHHMFADGASVNAGPAVRNAMQLYDSKGNKIQFTSSGAIPISSGKEVKYTLVNSDTVRYDSQFYSEYRINVDETCDYKLDHNDINSEISTSTRKPIVIMALGNYIGSDPQNQAQYGYLLRPVLFRSVNDREGQFSLARCMTFNGINEPGIMGLAYATHFIKSGTFFGVDKEGHYYMYLSASKANPLGAGRSMSILANGNLKEIWGAAAADGNSWDLATKGGVRWDIGAHGTANKGRSLDIQTTRSVYINIKGEDEDKVAKREIIAGNAITDIGGTLTETLGSHTVYIKGFRIETFEGSVSQSIQSELSVNVQGKYTEVAIQEKQCKFGKRKTTITSGNDELTVSIGGNLIETIQNGKRSTTIQGTGDIENTILINGSQKFSTTSGNFKVNVVLGSIDIKTNVGGVTVEGTNSTLKSTIMSKVEGSMVKVGNGLSLFGGIVSGLPGVPSHFDYTTGAPHQSSKTVSVAA